MDVNPWYLDWKLWSAVVAWLSFTMNVAPWINKKLKGTKLSVSPYHSFSLSHRIGSANIQWHMRFDNDGGDELGIEKVQIIVRDKTGELKLNAASFFQSKSTDAIVMAGFRLKPGESWQAYLWFCEDLPRDTNRQFRDMESATRKELSESALHNPMAKNVITASLYDKTLAFFNKNFKLQPSEYQIEIQVLTTQAKTYTFSGYRFVLYESDIAELRSHTQRYITGDGISWYSETNTWMFVPTTKN
ncbi:hypothetical protein [Pseudomonas brassicacearum]|uniref:hypothetical protein n=1 Tax=Pseudomonas brassicacearum TaxID=930166 RepID=UPI003D6B7659